MDSLFSIIVASYNNGRFLDEMIRSVTNQTWQNWELIIADDFSTDESKSILLKHAQNPRIKVVFHDENKGAGAAFRTAASHASGFVIGMLGADDALESNALERTMQKHLLNPQMSLITTLADAYDQDMNYIGPYSHSRILRSDELLINNLVISNFVTFKRDSYLKSQGFNPSFRKAVDHDLFLKLDEVGQIGGIPQRLYRYRLHNDGISQGDSGFKANQYSILARIDAYKRRIGTKKENFSKREFEALVISWHLREAHPLRWKNKKKCNAHLIQCFIQAPRVILKTSFWSIWIRNVFIKP